MIRDSKPIIAAFRYLHKIQPEAVKKLTGDKKAEALKFWEMLRTDKYSYMYPFPAFERKALDVYEATKVLASHILDFSIEDAEIFVKVAEEREERQKR